MNGYSLTAQTYRDLEKKGVYTKEKADKFVRIYEFLATCDKEDICNLFDSSAFNDITRGYIMLAVENSNIDEKAKEEIINNSKYVFDDTAAEEVLKRFHLD